MPTRSDPKDSADSLRKKRDAVQAKLTETEEALRRSEARFLALFRLTPLPIGMGTIEEGRLIDVNDRYAEFFGYSRQEMVGSTVEELKLWADPGDRKEAIRRLRQQGSVRNQEYRFRQKSGQVRYALLSMELLAFGAESMLIAILSDLTQLKESEARQIHLASIVESSEDAIISETLGGTILSWNRGAERLYGYRSEEIVGRSIKLLAPPNWEEEIQNILEQLERGQRVESLETVRRCKDGRLVDISLSVSPIRNAKGEIVGASAIARDIGGRKRTEEALLREKEELKRLNDIMLDREDRVIELKKEVNELLSRLGTPLKYQF